MIIQHIKEFITSLSDLFHDINNEKTIEIKERQEITILDLWLDDIWESLKSEWQFRDKTAIDFYDAYLDFKYRQKQWETLLNDKSSMDDIEFIKKYSANKVWIQNMFKENKLDEEMIKYEIEQISLKPPIFIPEKYFNSQYRWNTYKIYSFQFYHDFPLEINLHLKLDKRQFYNFLIFFTFVIKNPEIDNDFSLEIINQNYKSSIIAYELFKTLFELKYKEIDSFYASNKTYVSDSYDLFVSEGIYQKNDNHSEYPPILFKCFSLNLLYYSKEDLFLYLLKHLKLIRKKIKNFSDITNPETYYQNFEDKVKRFFEEGKRLFYNSQEIIYKKTKPELTRNIEKAKKPKLSIETLLGLFEKEYQKDIEKNKETSHLGYRSIKKIYDIYEKQIDISWGTFNKYARKIIEHSSRFESRRRQKSGGGFEYRIKIKKDKETSLEKGKQIEVLEVDEHEDYDNLIKVEEASLYERDGKIEKAIEIYEEIFYQYPEKLENYSGLYSSICFSLGYLYLETGACNIAEKYYKKGEEMSKLGKKMFLHFLIALFEIKLLRGDDKNLLEDVEELKSKYCNLTKKLLHEINQKNQFIDDLLLEDLDEYYIRSLTRDEVFKKQNPEFRLLLYIESNLLKLNLLILELLRKKILNLTLNKKFENKTADELIIPINIQAILDKAHQILDDYDKNKFSRANSWDFGLHEIYKLFFSNMNKIEKRPYDWDYDRISYGKFFPDYYKRYLYEVIEFDYEHMIYEPLDLFEFQSLDKISKLEYILKLCESKLKVPGLRVKWENTLNFYINLKTMANYAITLCEGVENIEFLNLANYLKEQVLKRIEAHETLLKKRGRR